MPRLDFSKRSSAAEWLDANGQSPELPEYLRDLAWFNRAALGPWVILRWLKRAVHRIGCKSFSLLDAGCGDGDVLRTIARWAARNGMRAELTGIDLDPNTISIARARSSGSDRVTFETADVFAFTPTRPPDFIVSSLLAHHLDDGRIVNLIRWMDSTARRAWLIYDLRRSAALYRAIGAVGTIARLHPMVVHDGRISVTRALTTFEWLDRIRAAGLDPAEVDIERFFYRLLISRLR